MSGIEHVVKGGTELIDILVSIATEELTEKTLNPFSIHLEVINLLTEEFSIRFYIRLESNLLY